MLVSVAKVCLSGYPSSRLLFIGHQDLCIRRLDVFNVVECFIILEVCITFELSTSMTTNVFSRHHDNKGHQREKDDKQMQDLNSRCHLSSVEYPIDHKQLDLLTLKPLFMRRQSRLRIASWQAKIYLSINFLRINMKGNAIPLSRESDSTARRPPRIHLSKMTSRANTSSFSSGPCTPRRGRTECSRPHHRHLWHMLRLLPQVLSLSPVGTVSLITKFSPFTRTIDPIQQTCQTKDKRLARSS